MKILKAIYAVVLSMSAATPVFAQSSPNLINGQKPTAAQWNSYFEAKQDVIPYVPCNPAGCTFTGKLGLSASDTNRASMNIPTGIAPSSPVAGDVWATVDGLFYSMNGTTYGPLVGLGNIAATLPLNYSVVGTLGTLSLGYDANFSVVGGVLALSTSGVALGAPSGGQLGAGTINVGGGYYVGGVAYDGLAHTWPQPQSISNATTSNSTATGALTVVGGVGIGGEMNVGGAFNASGQITGSSLVVTQGAAGGFNFLDRTSTGSGWQWYSTGGNASLYDLTNGINFITVTPGAGGRVQVVPTTASTSTTTGALTVAGGLGVAGAVNAGSVSAPLAGASAASSSDFMAGSVSDKALTPAAVFTAETTTPYGATTVFDASTFINTKVTLTGNIATMTCSNFKAGQAGTITFIQDATGGHTAAFCSLFKTAGGIAPSLSTPGNSVDVLSYACRTATFCVASLLKGVN